MFSQIFFVKPNIGREVTSITSFIREKNKLLGTDGGVIGLSGGLDSSVCATLIVEALGKENCLGIIIPAPNSDPNDEKDAETLARWLNIRTITHPLDEILGNFEIKNIPLETAKKYLIKQTYPLPPEISLPYIMRLRGRMYVLTYYAVKNNCFQCQTLQKTEWLLGWHDKFGDAAGDIAPIRHLWKSQVRQLGEYMGLPSTILDRAPTSGNDGLTDEEEIGMELSKVDMILYGIENNYSTDEIAEIAELDLVDVDRVINQVRFSVPGRKIPFMI